jgi:cytochrome c-type biogenesis protein CcmH
MNFLRISVTALCLAWATAGLAGLEKFDFTGNVDEDRYKELIAEIRCLVCQNQSLADSDAELAHDLRKEVYDLMQEGQGDAQIVDFMVARYGDFVLYNPPVKPSTYLLWYGPFVLLAIGFLFLIKTVRQRTRQTESGFSEQERARLKAVLGDEADGDKEDVDGVNKA